LQRQDADHCRRGDKIAKLGEPRHPCFLSLRLVSSPQPPPPATRRSRDDDHAHVVGERFVPDGLGELVEPRLDLGRADLVADVARKLAQIAGMEIAAALFFEMAAYKCGSTGCCAKKL
jgi:hypothetical protein